MHRWVFRIVAVLMPVLLLATAEIFLRMAGYGYPTSFFLQQRVNGRDVLTDNWQFGWRFFPKEIARTPQPVVFPLHKEPGTVRIFVFGESAAMGDPEPAFGLPRQLQAMLELQFPSNRFEVINVAMTAINSHVIREIARDCAPLEGDVWVIYMGNNEVVGPYGSGTVFSRQTPGLAFIRATLWLKKFRLVQWLGSFGRHGPVEWRGMEMFLQQRVPRDDPRMKRVYSNLQRNLGDIVRIGANAGARVIVSTVAVNLRDCPPFAPVHAKSIGPAAAANFDEHLRRGVTLAGERSFREALRVLHEAQDIAGPGDNHAEIPFQLGRCELALGSNDSARAHFDSAKEFDTLRFRADDAINAIAKSAPSPSHVVDGAAFLAAHSSNSIPGSDLFYEHVHLNFEGNYWLARAFFDEVVRALPARVTAAAASAGPPTLEQCARRLAWTDWERLRVCEEVRKRLQQAPFTAQSNHEERDREWRERIDALGATLTPESFRQAVAIYEGALRAAPRDWVLHEHFAELFEENGEVSAALEQWREVAQLLPHDIQAQYHLGNLLDSAGRSGEALPHFHAALQRDPASAEARNGLALALANLGRFAAAEREFQQLLRLRPTFTEARVNFGQLLARQGRADEAIAQYQLALQHETNSAAAHVNLGKLLAARGDKAAAIAHYEAALRSNPRHAVAHFNLGNALAASNPAEAIRHYEEAVRAQPNFTEAHLALALELAKHGKSAEAEKQFAEAIRLQPKSVDAHFNYGVLLANEKRFAEAAQQFSRVLEVEPDNLRARQFLDRVRRAP